MGVFGSRQSIWPLSQRECVALSFSDRGRPTTLWVFPLDHSLSEVMWALAASGVREDAA